MTALDTIANGLRSILDWLMSWGNDQKIVWQNTQGSATGIIYSDAIEIKHPRWSKLLALYTITCPGTPAPPLLTLQIWDEASQTWFWQWGDNNSLTPLCAGIVNGEFTVDAAGWTAKDSALSSVAGGVSGKCLQIQMSGVTPGYAKQAVTVTPGHRYTLRYYHKNSAGTGVLRLGTTAEGAEYHNSGSINDAAWTMRTVTFTALTDTLHVTLMSESDAADATFFDSVEIIAERGLATNAACFTPNVKKFRLAASYVTNINLSLQYY